MQRDLQRGNAPKRVSQRRMFRTGNPGVGDDDGITLQFRAMLLEKTCETFAADFFFTFDDERQIARQFCSGLEVSFYRLEMRKILTFVITRTPREQRTAA